MQANYWNRANIILNEFQENLHKAEKKEFLLLAKEWGIVINSLEDKIKALSELGVLTKDQLYRQDAYKELLIDSKKQIGKYSQKATEIISENQRIFAQAGLENSQEIISLVNVRFNKLPVKVIENFIGISQTGSPLYELLQKSYPETVTKLTNTLLESVALGRNPIETARLMKNDMDGNLTRAIKIARTEQMTIFRETSKMQMEESGVVKGYELIAEPDACELCMSQVDKIFEFNESPDLHPNCRCGFLPVL